MLGRQPDYLKESSLVQELWDRQKAGGDVILRPGRLELIYGPQTAEPPGMINGWMQHEFAYPSLLYPITGFGSVTGPLDADDAAGRSGKLFAFLGEKPDDPPSGGTFARHSHDGMLWLPFPGKWWLSYDGPTDSRVYCIVYDDTCGDAQHMLGKRGVNLREKNVNVLTANAVDLVTADPYRDGVYIQNQGAVDIYVRKGTSAGNAAAVGTGYKIPPDETYPLIGDLAFKGDLNARANGANAIARVIEVYS